MKYLKSFVQLSTISSFVLPLAIAPSLPLGSSNALAGIVGGYIPPLNRPLLQRTEGSGSRGCNRARKVDLQLLAPRDHIATTASHTPTFLWYVSQTSLPIRFVLSDPAIEKPILDKQLNPNKSGIIGVELPSNTKLTVGKKYRWTVSLICNKKHPSENTYAYAWIERVALKQVIREKDNTQRAIAYAQAGVWYDALANLYKLHVAQPQDRQAAQNFFELLNQVGLSKVVEEERERLNLPASKN